MSKVKRYTKEILLLLLAVVFLSPIYIMIVNAFKNRQELYENVLALPQSFSFQYFIEAMEKMNFTKAITNSLFVTITSVIVLAILASMTAYMLVRADNLLSKIIFATFIATMLIPFQTIMMPLLQFMNIISSDIGIPMLNTHGGLIFLHVGFNSSLSVFLYHGFIRSTIPISLEEAATIDGASRFGIFRKIVFPMLKPVTVTVLILNTIQVWNDFLLPSLVLTDTKLRTIPLSTFYFFGEFVVEWNLAMAALTLTILPVVIFYMLAQKHIIAGISEGGIK